MMNFFEWGYDVIVEWTSEKASFTYTKSSEWYNSNMKK